MMYYVALPPQFEQQHANELKLIHDLADFEGINLYRVVNQSVIRKYYKGHRPILIARSDFMDCPAKYERVINGFWGFVKDLQDSGLIRC